MRFDMITHEGESCDERGTSGEKHKLWIDELRSGNMARDSTGLVYWESLC